MQLNTIALQNVPNLPVEWLQMSANGYFHPGIFELVNITTGKMIFSEIPLHHDNAKTSIDYGM